MADNLLSARLKALIGQQVTLYSSVYNVTGPIAAVGDDYLVLADAVSAVYAPFASLSFVEVVFNNT